ncbi:AMP-binding protein [Congregibacter sp.]|uniref:AMP-binding protein n=1 Tax=Congregibacter sp. TaxID=2744308 RepID=UPI00385C3585
MTQHPSWFDGRTPLAEDCVLPLVIARRAAKDPDAPLVSFADGAQWTSQEALQRMEAMAELLADSGVRRGDRVPVWLPNGADLLQAWLGCNYLGAVFVPLNTDFRGSILAHVLSECDARLMILHPQLAERVSDIGDTAPPSLLLCGGRDAEQSSLIQESARYLEQLPSSTDAPPDAADLATWDLQMVIFTSGTTGPSKGVLCPYGHIYSTAQATYGYLNSSDTMLTELPIFHVGGAASAVAALCNDARLALYPGFSTQDYWQRIASEGATATSGLIGSMADFLAQSSPASTDRDNSLRMVTLMLTQQAMDVSERFGFSYLSGFNMTELSGPLITDIDCRVPGSLGKPRDGCECRVVDDHDLPVPDGEPGELIVRSEFPWTLFAGYMNRPGATAEAWRNGWFHTGDLVRHDSDGNYFFVDRKKDAIRRRGENVSSAEVEAEALQHPAVGEVCAVAVPSELAEDEILLAYVPTNDEAPSPRELAEFLIPRMPHYMVPRYFRAMTSLPRTATNKIRKIEVRSEGVTADCWDREKAGLTLKRTRFNS